jgi:hypothetical protein
MVGHHLRRRRAGFAWSIVNLLIFVVVVRILLAHEVFGAFVLVRASILFNVSVCQEDTLLSMAPRKRDA